jgi:hypothetical protein
MTLGTRQSKQDDKNSKNHKTGARNKPKTDRRHGGAAKQAVPTAAVNEASRRKNAGWKGQGKYLQGRRKR